MVKKNTTILTKAVQKVSKNSGAILIIIVVVSILTVFLFADRGALLFYRSYSDKEQLENEIKLLETKRDQLKEEKDKLENDPQHIEKVAREKYKMKKKDEKVYQVEMDKD